jgi:hypothetical protein
MKHAILLNDESTEMTTSWGIDQEINLWFIDYYIPNESNKNGFTVISFEFSLN